MILSFFEGLWSFILFFAFVIVPIAFLYGFFSQGAETKREKAEALETKKDEYRLPSEETAPYAPPIDTYRTVKKEPGSYAVVGPENMEAIVIRVETPSDGKYWIAILPLKEAKKSERVKTKKEAVALAIKLLKEHKEINNGTPKDD